MVSDNSEDMRKASPSGECQEQGASVHVVRTTCHPRMGVKGVTPLMPASLKGTLQIWGLDTYSCYFVIFPTVLPLLCEVRKHG